MVAALSKVFNLIILICKRIFLWFAYICTYCHARKLVLL